MSEDKGSAPEQQKGEQISLSELIRGFPKNWGKWGSDDEVGSLNYLTPAEGLRGKQAIQQGKSFTLAIQIGHLGPNGDPLFPGRKPPMRVNVIDKGNYVCGKGHSLVGGAEYCDDMLIMYLQGSTQCDSLAHFWLEDQLWNGYDARLTSGSVSKASILPIAEKGMVGRGILIDIARFRNQPYLVRGETFTHKDLLAAAAKQGVTIEKRDILVIRTGWLESFYQRDKNEFYENFNEPGLTVSKELCEWFQEMEIPTLVTDTLGNETSVEPNTGVMFPLHGALLRNLGIVFTEMVQLNALAEDCAKDGQYTFMYTAAPLKVVGGTGAPVNPVVIK